MYIPAAFREADTGRQHDFIDRHGFALLTSCGTHGLTATHLPLLLDRSRGPFGTLLGHFARANQQSQDADQEVLVVFSGPHAYISPTWYQSSDTVPTWNYIAVHAYGIMKRMHDPAALTRMLEALVQKYEASQPTPWQFDPDTPFNQKMREGIVGFEIEISRLEGKWKLNQNHPPERRHRVIAALNAAGGHDQVEMARLMEASFAD